VSSHEVGLLLLKNSIFYYLLGIKSLLEIIYLDTIDFFEKFQNLSIF